MASWVQLSPKTVMFWRSMRLTHKDCCFPHPWVWLEGRAGRCTGVTPKMAPTSCWFQWFHAPKKQCNINKETNIAKKYKPLGIYCSFMFSETTFFCLQGTPLALQTSPVPGGSCFGGRLSFAVAAGKLWIAGCRLIRGSVNSEPSLWEHGHWSPVYWEGISDVKCSAINRRMWQLRITFFSYWTDGIGTSYLGVLLQGQARIVLSSTSNKPTLALNFEHVHHWSLGDLSGPKVRSNPPKFGYSARSSNENLGFSWQSRLTHHRNTIHGSCKNDCLSWNTHTIFINSKLGKSSPRGGCRIVVLYGAVVPLRLSASTCFSHRRESCCL